MIQSHLEKGRQASPRQQTAACDCLVRIGSREVMFTMADGTYYTTIETLLDSSPRENFSLSVL